MLPKILPGETRNASETARLRPCRLHARKAHLKITLHERSGDDTGSTENTTNIDPNESTRKEKDPIPHRRDKSHASSLHKCLALNATNQIWIQPMKRR
jgi:hypothetical protein